MALTNKLAAIADGFRQSRGTTEKLSLDEMAVLASEPVGGGDAEEVQAQLDGVVSKTATKITTYASNISGLPSRMSSLEEVNIPNATTIPSSLFNSCKKLTSISLSDKLEVIEGHVFQGCSNLVLEELPNSLNSIGPSAFNSCGKITLTSLPSKITIIESNTFNGCENIALTALPDGVTTIGYGAFSYCGNITLTALPDGVTTIDRNAFERCINIALTSLPDSITTIGDGAFFNCPKMAINELPSSLDYLGSNVFGFFYDPQITTLTFKSTPSYVDPSAFYNGGKITTINVPWAEGEVAGAPWGAPNATVNYNYTGA